MPMVPKVFLPKLLPQNNMKKNTFTRSLALVAVIGLVLSALLPALTAF